MVHVCTHVFVDVIVNVHVSVSEQIMEEQDDNLNPSLQEPLLRSEHHLPAGADEEREQQWSVDDSLVPQDTSAVSGESAPENIVDGLPYQTSLLIKSLYFLDAL
jgi:hypothetical protein